jgi:hypothetical protein
MFLAMSLAPGIPAEIEHPAPIKKTTLPSDPSPFRANRIFSAISETFFNDFRFWKGRHN